jgi:histidyl-tRNA synthetase
MSRFDFFISHHQSDAGPEASLLAEMLRNQGYRVFLDVDTHQVGRLEELTKRALESSRGVVVLVGENFAQRVQGERDWVRLELAGR